MGRIQAKRVGPVAYYLYKDAKSCQPGKPQLHTKLGAVCIDERGGGEARGRGIRWTSRMRISLPHRCGTDNHSKVAHYQAGVTDRLWHVTA
jgi:hypothetical protein